MFRKDIVINKIWNGLRDGIQLATDRENNILPDLSLLTTTEHSSWWVRPCPVCDYTFRENDLVRRCPSCDQVYHDDPAYNLLCWHNHFANDNKCINHRCSYTWDGKLPNVKSGLQVPVRSIASVEEQFFAGLSRTWEVFGNAKIHIVKAGDLMVGNNCPNCFYKLRLGDRVVKCPCSPKCTVYFHNDIPRNWTCWNDWTGKQGKDFCPVSSRKYAAKPTFKPLNL